LDAIPDEESESDEEENFSDQAYLVRHQMVLDTMKARHAAFLEARRKMQEERRKIKSNK
jgi:hypothetical protein